MNINSCSYEMSIDTYTFSLGDSVCELGNLVVSYEIEGKVNVSLEIVNDSALYRSKFSQGIDVIRASLEAIDAKMIEEIDHVETMNDLTFPIEI